MPSMLSISIEARFMAGPLKAGCSSSHLQSFTSVPRQAFAVEG